VTDQSPDSRTPAFRQFAATVALFALAVIVLGTMFVLATYTSGVSKRSDKQIGELSARIDALTESQKLIVAQLGAEKVATGTAPTAAVPTKAAPTAESVVPFSRSATEAGLGINVAVARFTKTGSTTTSGTPATIRYGNYLDGTVGYSVAVSKGDVFQGDYYVDESTRTVEAKLLRGAEVTVYGWNGAAASKSAKITAADLARVLGRNDDAARRWQSTWFWIKIGRQGEILAATQTPPQ
jgi:hypothetical protein